MALLTEIVRYTDKYLRVHEIEDWPNALNGLQIGNSGQVTKIGATVDVSTRVLSEAAKKDVDLLLVHHGLFWPGLQPVTKALHRQLKIAFEDDIALYSAHLPLDIHSKIGNNAQLARLLGITSTQPFLEEKGQPIGLKARTSLPRADLVQRLRKTLAQKRRIGSLLSPVALGRRFTESPRKRSTPLSRAKRHTGLPSLPKNLG